VFYLTSIELCSPIQCYPCYIISNILYSIRYRISGSQLLAAMDMSSSVPHSELLSSKAGETSIILEKQEEFSQLFQEKEEALTRSDDRNGRTQQTVDVAEILRRWTHALQRIHKQSLHLVRY
jgi:hypothetical protein